MFTTLLLVIFAILPAAYSAELSDEELSTLVQNVVWDSGFLYKLPEKDQAEFNDYARENGLHLETTSQSQRNKMALQYFQTRNFGKSKSPLVALLSDLMQNKKIHLRGWGVRLTKLYNDLAKKSSANAMRMFIETIAIAIVDGDALIKDYCKLASARMYLSTPNTWFSGRCKTVIPDTMFTGDTENLRNNAKVLLEMHPNAKRLILEEVVVGVIEVLRVSPCVLDSRSNVEEVLEYAYKAFGIPREQTIFDPLPGIIKAIEEDADFKKNLSAAIQTFDSFVGDKQNAMIRVKRHLDSVDDDSQNAVSLIQRFIAKHEFDKSTLLYKLKDAIKTPQSG